MWRMIEEDPALGTTEMRMLVAFSIITGLSVNLSLLVRAQVNLKPNRHAVLAERTKQDKLFAAITQSKLSKKCLVNFSKGMRPFLQIISNLAEQQ